MRYFFTILFVLLTLSSEAQVDTLSYALGHQTTLGMLAGENRLLTNESQAREYIRGLEDALPSGNEMIDSVFVVNYSLGAMQGVFLSDGFEHQPLGKRPPVACIVEGLRRVADNKLVLPKDTIEAKRYISSFNDSINPVDLPAGEACKFFAAYGVMKAFQPGLQAYINQIGKSGIMANRQYFAQGMADVLSYMLSPGTSYDLGRMVGCSLFIEHINLNEKQPEVIREDYVAGAKGALHISELLISRGEIENFLEKRYGGTMYESQSVTQVERIDSLSDLRVRAGEPYDVSWTFEAFIPAEEDECPDDVLTEMQAFISYLSSHGIETAPVNKSELIYILKKESDYNRAMVSAIHQTALSETGISKYGYKYVCGVNGAGETVFGIVKADCSFKSEIRRAVLQIYGKKDEQYTQIEFHLGNESDFRQKAEAWAEFTGDNIGKVIVVELNGELVMAPCVNSEITGGACAVTGLSAEKINELFIRSANNPVHESILIQ